MKIPQEGYELQQDVHYYINWLEDALEDCAKTA